MPKLSPLKLAVTPRETKETRDKKCPLICHLVSLLPFRATPRFPTQESKVPFPLPHPSPSGCSSQAKRLHSAMRCGHQQPPHRQAQWMLWHRPYMVSGVLGSVVHGLHETVSSPAWPLVWFLVFLRTPPPGLLFLVQHPGNILQGLQALTHPHGFYSTLWNMAVSSPDVTPLSCRW